MKDLIKRFKAPTVIAIVISMIIFIVNVEQMTAASNKRHIVTPSRACSFLNDLDMPTRDYENTGKSGHWGKYEADSDKLILDTRDPNRFLNNLSYSVFGDKYTAKAVELDLNVNDISFSSNAINELTKYSDYLMYKVTGKHLTPEIKKAMLKKTEGEWIINGYKIKLKKEIFPDEKPIKGVASTSDHGAFSLMFIIEL